MTRVRPRHCSPDRATIWSSDSERGNFWNDLTALVQVQPNRDLFPVRAQYPGGDTLNIGLNYLSADEPQWFTLADVLASKVLTGKTPDIVQAVRFEPRGQQIGLMPIEVAGETIDPANR